MELKEWHHYLVKTEWSNGKTHTLRRGGVDPDTMLGHLDDLNKHQRKYNKAHITKIISVKEDHGQITK